MYSLWGSGNLSLLQELDCNWVTKTESNKSLHKEEKIFLSLLTF